MDSNLITVLFKVSLAIFIAGNLLDMGLRLKPRHAVLGLKNYYFAGHTLFWGFVAGPLLAYAITLMIPLQDSFAMGLVFLGMTPGVPFLPMIIHRVKGDLGYTAAFMLLVSVTAVFYIPLVVPFLFEGQSVSAWMIARPLLLVMFLPLLAGMLINRFSETFAFNAYPVVKKITVLFTVLACGFGALKYGGGVGESDISMAIVSIVIFFFVLTAFPYWFGFGLMHKEKIILSLGMSTRNLGAAIAPVLAMDTVDEGAVIMIGLGLPAMLLFAWIATLWFGRN